VLLIAGASGFLGTNALLAALDEGRDVAGAFHNNPISHEGVRAVATDLSTADAASRVLESLEPEWVLNCAAMANVDACERNPEDAARINTEVPRALASACRKAGVSLLHISTDAVFDGHNGDYEETDEPVPVNVYGRTKLAGERAVLDALPDAVVARTNFFGLSAGAQTGLADWIIGELEAGRRICGFTDVIITPLLANDLARVLFAMIDARLTGLYHVGGQGPVSKFDFAVMLARNLGLDEALIQPARVADARLVAPRPRDISLCSSRLESAIGRSMPSVESSVARLGELRRGGYSERLNALIGMQSNATN
jgi:dTDP-4-dehydrorhamnose reductase